MSFGNNKLQSYHVVPRESGATCQLAIQFSFVVKAGLREGIRSEASHEYHGAAQLTLLAHLGHLRRCPSLCFFGPAVYYLQPIAGVLCPMCGTLHI